MYKRSEIKELSNEGLISNFFWYGIQMCNERGTKRDDKELAWRCDELGKRGIADAEKLKDIVFERK